jgi:sugar phosphate isomerase/epimerase
MRSGLSTHVFLQQRLNPSLLETLVRGGAKSIEVFAARHHFDYTDRGAQQELGNWFRSNDVTASMHMPLFADEAHWTKHTQPTLNLISLNKSTRIETMDEVKRALEAAEQVPFTSCTLHLGLKDDQWDTRALDDSLTAIEHLKAFAGPLGVKLLLENLGNDVAKPEHLLEIVRVGHFSTVGFAFDVGHANLGSGSAETKDGPAKSAVELAFDAFTPVADRVVQIQVSDNNGVRDEHLWPQVDVEHGYIDWAMVKTKMSAFPAETVVSLELAHELGDTPAQVVDDALAAWKMLGL